MNKKIVFPEPKLQADFAFALKRFRSTYLQSALFETVRNMSIAEIDKQLAKYVADKDLALMAQVAPTISAAQLELSRFLKLYAGLWPMLQVIFVRTP